jgi:hypothetical protein
MHVRSIMPKPLESGCHDGQRSKRPRYSDNLPSSSAPSSACDLHNLML